MPRKRSGDGKAANQDLGPRGEVYLEYKQVGQAMKVIAVDAATGTEVVIMGPVSASQKDLERIAVRKLKAQLDKAQAESSDETDDDPDSKGWIA